MPITYRFSGGEIQRSASLMLSSDTPLDTNDRRAAQTLYEYVGAERLRALPFVSTGKPDPSAVVEAVENLVRSEAQPSANDQSSELGTPVEHRVERPAYETWYSRLGRWSGPYGSRASQQELIEKWVSSNEDGAAWLASRLLSEHNADAISGGFRVLLRFGQTAMPHIIRSLELASRGEDSGPALVFLRFCRECDKSTLAPWTWRLLDLMPLFVRHFDSDVRGAAYLLYAEILDRPKALDLLSSAKQRETDSELIEIIDEILQEL